MTHRPNIDRHVERLTSGSRAQWEREVAEKRLAWFDGQAGRFAFGPQPTPRQAFEMVFFDYMGLARKDLEVVSESDDEIVWLSRNPCPTLEACVKVGVDTREVCRAVYEKPTQALVSRLDPRLRFLRDYNEIRPHAPYCRERILRVDFERFMAIALEEAEQSKREGNKGYGAVVALGNEVLSRAHDTAVTEIDPSRHAEVNAIRQAVRVAGNSNLSGAIVFATCEPCPMCAALAVWANVSAIVYGTSIAETAAMGRTRIHIGAGEVVAKGPALIEVIGGIQAEACLGMCS